MVGHAEPAFASGLQEFCPKQLIFATNVLRIGNVKPEKVIQYNATGKVEVAYDDTQQFLIDSP
jgi:hypothetical protein